MKDDVFGTQIRFTGQATDQVILPAGNHRKAVILSANQNQGIYYYFGQDSTGPYGIYLSINCSPVIITRDMIGGLIDADLHAIATSGGGKFSIIVSYYK